MPLKQLQPCSRMALVLCLQTAHTQPSIMWSSPYAAAVPSYRIPDRKLYGVHSAAAFA